MVKTNHKPPGEEEKYYAIILLWQVNTNSLAEATWIELHIRIV